MKDKQNTSLSEDLELTDEELDQLASELFYDDFVIKKQREIISFLDELKHIANQAKTPEEYVAYLHCIWTLVPELTAATLLNIFL